MSIIRKYKTTLHKSNKSKIAIHDNRGNTYKLTRNGELESLDLTQKDHLLNEVKVYDQITRQWIATGEKTIDKSVIRAIPIKSIKDLQINIVSRPQYNYSKTQRLSYVNVINGEFVITTVPHGVFDFEYQPIKHRVHRPKSRALQPSCVSKMPDATYQAFIDARATIDTSKPRIDLVKRKPTVKTVDSVTILRVSPTINYAPLAKPRTALEDWRVYLSSKVNKSGFSTGVNHSMLVYDLNNNRFDLKPFMYYMRRVELLGY